MSDTMIQHFTYFFDLLGTIVFAFSGVLMAGKMQMDFIGVLVLASATAIGGGTLRDLLIGATPVFWIKDSHYLLTIGLTCIAGMWVAKSKYRMPWYLLPVLDAIGLAVFVVIGAQKALHFGTTGVIAVVMGCFTGVAGGMIRDTLAGVVPMVLRKELYATPCILSGSIYVLLIDVGAGHPVAMLVSMTSLLALRIPAIFKHWSLPTFVLTNKDE